MRGHISAQQEQGQGSTPTRRRPGTPVRVSAGRSSVARGLSTFGGGTSPQRVLRASAPSLSAFCVNGSGITPARNPMSGRAAAVGGVNSGRHSDSSFGSGGGSMSGSGGHSMSGRGSVSDSAPGSDVSPPRRTTTRVVDGPRTVGVVAAEAGSMLRLEPTVPPVFHRHYCASQDGSCASEVDEEIPEALSCNGESVCTEGISEYQYDADFHHEQSDDNETYDAMPHTYAAPPLTAARPSPAAPAAAPSAPPASAAASPAAATAREVARPFIRSYSSVCSSASTSPARDEPSGEMRLDDAGLVGGYCHDLEAAAYEYDDQDEVSTSPGLTDRGYDSFLHGQLSEAEARDDDDDAVFAHCSAELQEYRRVAGRYQAQLRVYQDLLGRHQMGLLPAEDHDDDDSDNDDLRCYSSDDEDDGQLRSPYHVRWEGYGARALGTREQQRAEEAEEADEAEEAEEAEERRRRFAEDGERYAEQYAAHDVDDISYLMPHHGHGYDNYEIPPTPPYWSASASQFRWQLEYLQDPQRFMASHGYDYDSYALYGEREELDSELEAAAAGSGGGGERTWTPRNVAFGTSWTASGWLHSGLFCSSTLKHKPDDTTRRVLEDKEWIYALLQELPGVDPDDDRVQGTLAALRGLKSCSRPTSSARPSSSLTLKAVAARPPSAVTRAVLPSLPTPGGGPMALPSSSLSSSPSRVHGGGGGGGTKPPSAASSSKPREQSASRFSPAAAAGAIVR